MQKIALVNEMHNISKGGVHHSVEALREALGEAGIESEVIAMKSRSSIYNGIVSLPYFKEIFIWPVWNLFTAKRLKKLGFSSALYRGGTSILLLPKTPFRKVVYTRGILHRQLKILTQIDVSTMIKLISYVLLPITFVLEKISFSFADRIIASKDIFKEYLVDNLGINSEYEIIPQMVNVNRPNKAINKKYDLLYIGRKSAPKNWGLIKDLAKLNKYSIAAAVPAENDSSESVDGIDTFHKIPYENMPDFISSAKIFLMPSHVESGPRVTLEAMACGLPVVASVDGGGGFIEDGVNGFIIADNSLEAYVEKIDFLLSNKDSCETMSRKNAKKSYNYSPDALAPIYIKALTEWG